MLMLLSVLQAIRPSALHSWRGSWETWCPVSPQISRTFRPPGLPTPEIPRAEAEAKYRNKMGWPRLLFSILFLIRSNLDNRVKSSTMRLRPHLGLNVLWCERSDECYWIPRVPPCSPLGTVQPTAMLLQVPLLTAPSWWNPGFAPVQSKGEPL